MAGLDVLHAHALPVQEIAQTLGSVSLVDTLSAALLGKLKHVLSKLVDRVIDALGATVHDIDTVVARVLNELLHVAAKSRKVGGDAWYTHNRAFCRSVTPRLIVRREDTQMGAAHKVIVVKRQHGVGRAQELGMENNLDAVRGMVEELYPADLVQNRVFMVVEHVVGNNGREPMPLHGEETTTKEDTVLAGDQFLLIRQRVTLVPLERALEDAAANATLDNIDGVSQRLDDGLPLQCFNSQGSGLGRHDDESNNRGLASGGLQAVVKTGKRLNEHIHTLIPELVATGSEEVEGVFWLEIVMAIKVTADKVVDLFLGLLMEVLELMHGRELGDVETVGEDTIGLALEQMLTLVGGDVGNGGEDIARMGGSSLDAVSVIDTALSSLSINIEPLKVVIEVHRACAQVATEKSGMCREDSRNVNLPPLGQW